MLGAPALSVRAAGARPRAPPVHCAAAGPLGPHPRRGRRRRGGHLVCSTLTQFDLIKLSAEGCRITNPEAMNHHSLRYLSLAKSDLSTLGFFHGNELEFLNMEETKITDLEPLCGQKFLKKLNLFRFSFQNLELEIRKDIYLSKCH